MEEPERGLQVRPVQVLQHEQHRGDRGQLRQHPQDSAEQLLLTDSRHVFGRRQALLVRQQPGEHRPGGDRGRHRSTLCASQRVRQRQVWHCVGQLGAPAGQQHIPAVRGLAGELGDQPRLADAGVAAHEHDDRLSSLRVAEKLAHLVELGRPSDEGAARIIKHNVIIPARYDNPRRFLAVGLPRGSYRYLGSGPGREHPSGVMPRSLTSVVELSEQVLAI
jgi:hypothetical protein